LVRLRTEYEEGTGTIKELAAKFGLNYFTVRNRSVIEKWTTSKAEIKRRRDDGETVAVEVQAAHGNASIDQSRIDGIAASYLTAVPAPTMARATLTAAVTRLKRIEQPAGCPEDHEGWRQEVSRLLGVAIWKLAARLSHEVETLPIQSAPVALGILTDKKLILTGQPTSYNFQVSTQLTHADVLKRINGTAEKPLPAPSK
jgi:hypothetical protein